MCKSFLDKHTRYIRTAQVHVPVAMDVARLYGDGNKCIEQQEMRIEWEKQQEVVMNL